MKQHLAGQRPQCDWRGEADPNVGGEGKGATSGISCSETTFSRQHPLKWSIKHLL